MGIIGGTFRAAGNLAARGAAAAGNHIKQRLSPVTIAKEMGAAVDRAASQGAAEVAQALYTGSPFVPYGPTEKPLPVTSPDQGNVHGTGAGQQQAAAQVRERETPRPPSNAQMDWSSYGGSSKASNTHEAHASIYYTQNQPTSSHAERLQQAAARVPQQSNGMERGR